MEVVNPKDPIEDWEFTMTKKEAQWWLNRVHEHLIFMRDVGIPLFNRVFAEKPKP